MNLFSKIFRSKPAKVECPRCLGKGHVNNEDIKRLRKELKWMPGSCAYCNGTGKVDPKILKIIAADTSYLTVDIPAKEAKKLITGDPEALNRAKKFDQDYDSFIAQIRDHYLLSNWDTNQIFSFFCDTYPDSYATENDKNNLLDFIKLVIQNIENKGNI